MATREAIYVQNNDKTFTVTWEGFTTSADDGEPVKLARYADKTVQLIGNIGTGGSITMQGSNDGVTWGTLSDQNAVDVVLATTAGVLSVIAENPLWIRPKCTAGAGATDLDVIICGAVRGV